mmetsp:Transcript_6509/g.17582  ORF Transcript_6509/g.17582 Transcript_6509/m.17582 type:complete len:244 (+) Transcript_6509:1213-1944(+)
MADLAVEGNPHGVVSDDPCQSVRGVQEVRRHDAVEGHLVSLLQARGHLRRELHADIIPKVDGAVALAHLPPPLEDHGVVAVNLITGSPRVHVCLEVQPLHLRHGSNMILGRGPRRGLSLPGRGLIGRCGRRGLRDRGTLCGWHGRGLLRDGGMLCSRRGCGLLRERSLAGGRAAVFAHVGVRGSLPLRVRLLLPSRLPVHFEGRLHQDRRIPAVAALRGGEEAAEGKGGWPKDTRHIPRSLLC